MLLSLVIVNDVMDVLAVAHVAACVKVRAVAQAGICPWLNDTLEVQFAAVHERLPCPAVSTSLRHMPLGGAGSNQLLCAG